MWLNPDFVSLVGDITFFPFIIPGFSGKLFQRKCEKKTRECFDSELCLLVKFYR